MTRREVTSPLSSRGSGCRGLRSETSHLMATLYQSARSAEAALDALLFYIGKLDWKWRWLDLESFVHLSGAETPYSNP